MLGWPFQGRIVKARTPGDIPGCAIAVYLSAVIGAESSVKSVGVSRHFVQIALKRRAVPVAVAAPDPVAAFIVSFDRGTFPQLVRTPDARVKTRQAERS